MRDHVIKSNGSLETTYSILECSSCYFSTKFWEVVGRYINYIISKKGILNLFFR